MKTQGFPENDSSHKQVLCVTIVTLQKQRNGRGYVCYRCNCYTLDY